MPPMAKDKGQGTGPFVVKTPKGLTRYRVAVTMADGRRVWRTRPTKRLAERARRQLVEMRELDLDPTRQTLAEYLRSWLGALANAKHQRVRPRTLAFYSMIVEQHIIPGLGAYKLATVTNRRIQQWLDADESAPGTVKHHHAVLRQALNVAVRQRLLAYNPAIGVDLPEVDDDIAKPLTLPEARALLTATSKDRLGVLWRLALVTGLRQGELLGLTWEDYDDGTRADAMGGRTGARGRRDGDAPLAPLRGTPHHERQRADGAGSEGLYVPTDRGGTLTVTAQLQRLSPEHGGDKYGWARTPTKAARKVERIALDPATAAALDAHRKAMATERRPDWLYHGMVFVTPNGRPYHGKDVYLAFQAACRKAGIPERRFHDLRGTSATLMREAGVAEDTRMARLGHNSTSMARHYAQASEVQDRAAAEQLGRALSG